MTVVSPMPSEFPVPRKAVIALGFDGRAAQTGPVSTLPFGVVGERLPAAARHGIQQAVEEVLSAGLMELVFLTPDVAALAGERGQPKQVMLPRSPGGNGLGEALGTARTLIGAAPVVVLAPKRLATTGPGVVARLLAAYRERGGNLAVVDDDGTLEQQGTFAALSRGTAGPYLLQPAVLEQLSRGGELADALLALAEAWPVTALPARREQDLPMPRLAGVAD